MDSSLPILFLTAAVVKESTIEKKKKMNYVNIVKISIEARWIKLCICFEVS